MSDPKIRLEELRAAIHAENISYGELAELQNLAEHIEPGDVELLEWAGVPEHPPETTRYAIAVVFSIDGENECDAYETLTTALDELTRDNLAGFTIEYATGGFVCPPDHDPDSTDWDIPELRWHGEPVPRADDEGGLSA